MSAKVCAFKVKLFKMYNTYICNVIMNVEEFSLRIAYVQKKFTNFG